MKKVILFLLLATSCAGFANAQIAPKDSVNAKQRPAFKHAPFKPQPKNFNGKKFGNGFPQNKAKINLTKEQRVQLKNINDDYEKQLLQLQSSDVITLGEYKSKLADLKKDHKAKLQSIYTDEQKQKIAEAKKNVEVNRKVAETARLERLKLTLNLTDDQVAKIKQQQQDLQKQLKDVRENDKLLQEQKREQLKEILQQHKDDLKLILTDEQQKKLAQQKNNFGNRNFGGRGFGNNGARRNFF